MWLYQRPREAAPCSAHPAGWPWHSSTIQDSTFWALLICQGDCPSSCPHCAAEPYLHCHQCCRRAACKAGNQDAATSVADFCCWSATAGIAQTPKESHGTRKWEGCFLMAIRPPNRRTWVHPSWGWLPRRLVPQIWLATANVPSKCTCDARLLQHGWLPYHQI